MITDKKEALSILRLDCERLEDCAESLRDDRDIVLAALQTAALLPEPGAEAVLEYASER